MPKNIMCKNCNNLLNGWCEKKIDSPDPDMVRDCQYFRQKTNADRIRAMSDEELAEIIMCPYHIDPDLCIKKIDCLSCCEEWLKQPAETKL